MVDLWVEKQKDERVLAVFKMRRDGLLHKLLFSARLKAKDE